MLEMYPFISSILHLTAQKAALQLKIKKNILTEDTFIESSRKDFTTKTLRLLR